MPAATLRPVPTFEQVVRLKDPVLFKPQRTIEVSRPDPNIFLEHEDRLGQNNMAIMQAAMAAMSMRQDASAQGIDMDLMRQLTHTQQEPNTSIRQGFANLPPQIAAAMEPEFAEIGQPIQNREQKSQAFTR